MFSILVWFSSFVLVFLSRGFRMSSLSNDLKYIENKKKSQRRASIASDSDPAAKTADDRDPAAAPPWCAAAALRALDGVDIAARRALT